MRLFLAVDLPYRVKDKLDYQISDLKKEYANYNWVPKDNFHLTLLFLGEVGSEKEIENIKSSVEETIFDIDSFVFYSAGADIIINDKIVLYISFRREKTAEEIVLKLKNKLRVQDDKKFVPHLSIARFKLPSKQQYFHLKKKLARLPIDIDFPVQKIHLFQSILNRQKPIYKRIASFSLLKND